MLVIRSSTLAGFTSNVIPTLLKSSRLLGDAEASTIFLNVNPNSLTVTSAYVEPELLKAKGYDSYQFVRNGFFCADIHDSKEGAPVFNRIVSLKSSFKLPKA